MLKFIFKQFLYGRVYLWMRPRLGGIFLTLIIIFLIFYAHSEYLKYVEFKEKSSIGYIGLSFIIKNSLILLVAIFYFYFYSSLNRTKKNIENTKDETKNHDDRVDSLDYFLKDDEINRKD
tara:strand:- start:69 stop:428 length:360 start_codon:yes stop_codon:yes gene_type:complete